MTSNSRSPFHDPERSNQEPDYDAWTGLIHHGAHAHASAIPLHQGNVNSGGYARFDNPSVSALEAKFRGLEGARHTLATSSGMAAVTLALLGLARAGQHILVHRTTFIGTESLMHLLLPRWGIEVESVDMMDADALRIALTRRPALVFCEVLSNPAFELLDIQAVIHAAETVEIPVVVDNTLLTPLAIRPLAQGATVVLHSASKYLGGHGDALGGLVSTNSDKVSVGLADVRRLFGSIMTPFNAFLISRGLLTLPARMARHSANAKRLAEYLQASPAVRRVDYPGLPDDPRHVLACRMLKGFGGVLCFEPNDPTDVPSIIDRLRLCSTRHSFGEPSTVARADDRAPHRIRVSVGLEDPEDLISDLAQALIIEPAKAIG